VYKISSPEITNKNKLMMGRYSLCLLLLVFFLCGCVSQKVKKNDEYKELSVSTVTIDLEEKPKSAASDKTSHAAVTIDMVLTLTSTNLIFITHLYFVRSLLVTLMMVEVLLKKPQT